MTAIILSSLALAFSLSAFLIAFFSIPKIFQAILEKRAKELSTHTVVPGHVFEAMEKDPDFMPSADEIEFPSQIKVAEARTKKKYG